jgi:HAMP domain-containing protein
MSVWDCVAVLLLAVAFIAGCAACAMRDLRDDLDRAETRRVRVAAGMTDDEAAGLL